MITQYYIAWGTNKIFTRREEVINAYIGENYSCVYESVLDDYLADHYSMVEVFEMPDCEKETVKKDLECGLWDNIVNEWNVDILHITSDGPVTAELERL